MSEREPARAEDTLGLEMEFERYKAYFDSEPLNRMLGIELLEARPGYSKIRLQKSEKTPQGIGGSLHGGVLASLVDVAMIAAIFADRRPGQTPAGTAELAISYLRQAHGDFVTAEAHVLKHGRQMANIEVEIKDAGGVLCAKGRTVYAFRVTD